MSLGTCARCGATAEQGWLELQPDGTWRCVNRKACSRRLMRRRQQRIFGGDEQLRRCAAGVAQVDRAVTAFRTPHEPARFEPPTGLAA